MPKTPATRNAHAALTAAATAILRKHTPEERESAFVPCRACDGRGRVPLPRESRETLALLRRRGASSGADVARASNIKHTAANQRLERLRGLGFVTRERDGKEWIYTAVARPKDGGG